MVSTPERAGAGDRRHRTSGASVRRPAAASIHRANRHQLPGVCALAATSARAPATRERRNAHGCGRRGRICGLGAPDSHVSAHLRHSAQRPDPRAGLRSATSFKSVHCARPSVAITPSVGRHLIGEQTMTVDIPTSECGCNPCACDPCQCATRQAGAAVAQLRGNCRCGPGCACGNACRCARVG